jgi:hypothetical protein
MDVPGATTVRIPVAEPIAAAAGLLLLQVPPLMMLRNVSGTSAVHKGGTYPVRLPGEERTVTTAVSDAEQLLLLVAVSVGTKVPAVPYAFEAFMTVEEDASPKLHEYADKEPSETVKFTGRPGSVGSGLKDEIAITGKAFTDTVLVAVALQPVMLPVMV